MPMFELTFHGRRREFKRKVSVKSPNDGTLRKSAMRVWDRFLSGCGWHVTRITATALEDMPSHGISAGDTREITPR